MGVAFPAGAVLRVTVHFLFWQGLGTLQNVNQQAGGITLATMLLEVSFPAGDVVGGDMWLKDQRGLLDAKDTGSLESLDYGRIGLDLQVGFAIQKLQIGLEQ